MCGKLHFWVVGLSAIVGGTGDDKPATKAALPANREQAEAFFNRLDKNHDGKLTDDEIPERMRLRLSAIDTNGDKAIDKKEFLRSFDRMQASVKATKGGRKFDSGNEIDSKSESAKPSTGNVPKSAAKPEKSGKFAKKKADGMPDPEAIFARMDADGDGKLSKDEARGPMRENFERIDLNKDGFISKDEFKKALAVLRRLRGEGAGGPGAEGERGNTSPRELFNRQDLDADGRVTRAEAKGILSERFDELDLDKDGKLTLQEVEAGLKSNKADKMPSKKAGKKAMS